MVPSRPVRVVVVGVCASGKTTLVQNLRSWGIDAVSVAQEHSNVAQLWRHPEPDYLVYLEAGLEAIRYRRPVGWGGARLRLQRQRLEHARRHCWFYLRTDGLNEEQVATAIRTGLQLEGADRSRRILPPGGRDMSFSRGRPRGGSPDRDHRSGRAGRANQEFIDSYSLSTHN